MIPVIRFNNLQSGACAMAKNTLASYSRPGARQRAKRTAAILTEALVAAAILMIGVVVVAKSSVSLQRLWSDTRQFQLATDELANQLQRLTRLPARDAAEQINNLRVSEPISAVLPEAKIQAELLQDANGDRVSLSIQWKRFGTSNPLTLVGWLKQPVSDILQPDVAAEPGSREQLLQARND